MAQVKKAEVQDAILAAAYELFQLKGYSGTSIGEIARLAGVSASNIYVYFSSKLDILFSLYEPWLQVRLERLSRDVPEIEAPEDRLRFILTVLWKDIPAEDNGFANNLMQALSTATADEGYDRSLLIWAEDRVAKLVRDCLPPDRAAGLDASDLAHLLFMAFDGFAMNHKLVGPSTGVDGVIELTVRLLRGRQD